MLILHDSEQFSKSLKIQKCPIVKEFLTCFFFKLHRDSSQETIKTTINCSYEYTILFSEHLGLCGLRVLVY